MSAWENPYSSPEKFGLKIVGIISDNDDPYSFSLFCVWQHEDGTLYYGEDSGCSCPVPFEDFNSLDDLNRLDDLSGFDEDLDSFLDCKVSNALDADKIALNVKVTRAFNDTVEEKFVAYREGLVEKYGDD